MTQQDLVGMLAQIATGAVGATGGATGSVAGGGVGADIFQELRHRKHSPRQWAAAAALLPPLEQALPRWRAIR